MSNNSKLLWVVGVGGVAVLGGLMASLYMSPPAVDRAAMREYAASRRRRGDFGR